LHAFLGQESSAGALDFSLLQPRPVAVKGGPLEVAEHKVNVVGVTTKVATLVRHLVTSLPTP